MKQKICVVGLGYVGLPLAVEFGKQDNIIGFDINETRIMELRKNIDSTNEISSSEIKKSNIVFTSDPLDIKKSDFIIIAVPTPIDKTKKPDLKYLKSASELVGKNLAKNTIVIYESTVYPGVTEEFCTPILEKESGLKCGEDFKIGYSPERINPGDKEHTVDKIIKIVSGMDDQTTEKVAQVYNTIIKAGVFKAKTIKTAEAAKVIENIQRDLNIALMNELSIIFHKLGINTKDVIDAAATKWNFHKYHPGLVGGHCIGIDPYYLTYKAEQAGYDPQVILAGRKINDNMHNFVVELLLNSLNEAGKAPSKSSVLILGLTFKENVVDYRNSRTKNLIEELKKHDITIHAHDPLLGKTEKKFSVKNQELKDIPKVDAVILTVAHNDFKKISLKELKAKLNANPVLIDIKNFYNYSEAEKEGFIYKTL